MSREERFCLANHEMAKSHWCLIDNPYVKIRNSIRLDLNLPGILADPHKKRN